MADRAPRYAWFALTVLSLSSFLNYADRQIVSPLQVSSWSVVPARTSAASLP